MKATPGKKWHTATVKGKRVLRSPDGRTFHGTAAEIRTLDMMPGRRDMLADDLRFVRRAFADKETAREIAEERRMSAILANAADIFAGERVTLPKAVCILAKAAARVDGKSLEQFIADAVEACVCEARCDCGGELPLTRHEKAALRRFEVAGYAKAV